ncbi:MAG: ABC transporter ATP-binding protein [Actinobacteria bacterium]|nr:ABC transporter ATP-binding protein [Actinomycetota bacterium]
MRAVDGVSLSVGPGERVALLGPNGAGKTTTLLMLLGVLTPDAGTVSIFGHRLPKQRQRAMEDVGFVAGYLPLAERLKVREFLGLYARLYSDADVNDTIERGLARFGVAHLADAMGGELSSGQKTLVGIVKATLHEPRLLVLDEPTASLDPDVAYRVRTGLLSYADATGAAMLITSHNMAEVQQLAHRVVFVQAGRIAADDTPEAVAALFGRDDLEGVFLHLAEEL